MKYLFALTFLLSTITGHIMAAEEIKHSVVKTDGNIQIRAYQAVMLAEVTVGGSQEGATSRAFRTLFNYIQGANIAQQKIAMTAPVAQTAADVESQKIAMTTPVAQQATADNKWRVAFYLPADFTPENTPVPESEAITIGQMPAKQMAAIEFSGRSTVKNMQEHEAQLRAYLTENKIRFKEPAIYAYYNPPWVPWFMRRNEVLFELKN